MNDSANQNHRQNIATSATGVPADARLGRWRSEGARLLHDIQRRLAEAKQAYTTGRAAIIAEAEKKRDELARTYGERLRDFDRGQQDAIDRLQAEVSELLDYREIGGWPS